jgi:hypothetical protein
MLTSKGGLTSNGCWDEGCWCEGDGCAICLERLCSIAALVLTGLNQNQFFGLTPHALHLFSFKMPVLIFVKNLKYLYK